MLRVDRDVEDVAVAAVELWGSRRAVRLLPSKDLAAVLGVNANTVLRTLRQLRDEGLLEFRRGRGITITGTAEQSAVVERANALLHYARKQGYKADELVRIIQQLG